MQPGLVLDGFARDKMLFGVAQKGPLKKASRNLPLGNLRRMIAGGCGWPTVIRRKAEKSESSW
jgi:hypothetical protein